ncbi:MAG: lipocalin family protein [Fibrobacter sp.]|nr:lipocalin family protein [Fibrobacter sp.]
MKTKILTLLAASTLAFFTACSDDSGSNKTPAEICAEGLSEDCLVGTWTLKSISQKGNNEIITDFSAAQGGTLVFSEDSLYHYTRSTAGECPGSLSGGTDDKGHWSINEGTLIFKANKEGDCVEFGKTFTTTPKIEVVGETVTLILNTVLFQEAESDGMFAGNDTEVFVRTE